MESRRGLTNESIVKVNPFTIERAIGRSCDLFEGERGVRKVRDSLSSGSTKTFCDVIDSNIWMRDHLLVKGVDYE